MNDADDRQLLLATHAGDEPAARAFWVRFAPGLIAYAEAILPPGLSGEDVVQTAMCSVLAQKRRVLARVENVPAWLTRLVRNTALNSLRAARRERARSKTIGMARRGEQRRTASPAGGAHELKEAVGALPRRLRETVVLRHVGGLTFDQMALALEINRNTVAARYRAALVRLREMLGREPGPDSTADGAVAMEVLNG